MITRFALVASAAGLVVACGGSESGHEPAFELGEEDEHAVLEHEQGELPLDVKAREDEEKPSKKDTEDSSKDDEHAKDTEDSSKDDEHAKDDTHGNAGGAGGAGNTPEAGQGGAAPKPSDPGNSAGAGGAQSDPDALRFADVKCNYEDIGWEGPIEGARLDCAFDVLGDASRKVTLSCETPEGTPIDCGPSSTGVQVWPYEASPLPVSDQNRGRATFSAPTDGLGGTILSVVLVANDGSETVEHRLDIQILPDDKINVAPSISVDCGVPQGSPVTVKNGVNHSCAFVIADPDPTDFQWEIKPVGPAPQGLVVTPAAASGVGRYEDTMAIIPYAVTAGETFTYELIASDGVAPPVKETVTIVVE